MANGLSNLAASIDVYELQIVLGLPAIQATGGFKDVHIPYTGIGNPEDTSVDITRAWYSLDDGATWSVMTPTTDNVSTGLTFSPSGTPLTFKWQARADLGSSLYNNLIKIAFKASGTKGDSLQTTRNAIFERATVDQSSTVSQSVQLPDDYAGVFGNELLVNAPKTQ
jgi:hypothetical protein